MLISPVKVLVELTIKIQFPTENFVRDLDGGLKNKKGMLGNTIMNTVTLDVKARMQMLPKRSLGGRSLSKKDDQNFMYDIYTCISSLLFSSCIRSMATIY